MGAVLMRKQIFDTVFDRMDRAVIHGHFGKTISPWRQASALDLLTLRRHDRNAATGERLQPASPTMVKRFRVLAGGAWPGADGLQFGPQSRSSSSSRGT